jgi:hypothetical protein
LLVYSSVGYAYRFNIDRFTKEIEVFHLADGDFKSKYNEIVDPRREIDLFIRYDNIFSGYLDEICSNAVGNIMVKLLLTNIKTNIKTEPEIEFDIENSSLENSFHPECKKLYMNLSQYDSRGVKNVSQCGINEKGEFVERKSNITDGLFHELCHALHYISGSVKYGRETLEYVYRGSPLGISLWQGPKRNDEELYNITGIFRCGTKMGFDPVNCNMFSLYDSCQSGSQIIQRVFHKTFFVKVLRKMQELRTYYKNLGQDILSGIEAFLLDIPKYALES